MNQKPLLQNYSRRHAMPKKHRAWWLWLILIAALAYCGNVLRLKASAYIARLSIPPTVDTTILQNEFAALQAANPDVTISMAIIQADNGTLATFGTTSNMAAASTTKVLTALAYLHSVELGKKSLGDDIGNYDAKWQLKQMVNQSNNVAWDLMTATVGRAQLGAYAKSIGASSFTLGANTMTAVDEAKILDKLYNGKLLNSSHTKLLLSFMQNTNDETLIPATLSGITVYHKYGILAGVVNDVAIIKFAPHPIAIAIMTQANDTDYTARAKLFGDIIALVSKTYNN